MELLQNMVDYAPGTIPVGRIGVFIIGILLSLMLRKIVSSLLKKPRKKIENFFTILLDGLAGSMAFLVVFTGFYFSLLALNIHGTVNLVALNIIQILLTFTVIRILFVVIDDVALQMGSLAGETESQLDDQLIPVLRKLTKFALAAIGIVFFMQLKNYPVSGIIAGLGIGGLAFAFAAQDSIAGIFASIALFLDRPFMVGDFVQVGGVSGTIEEVGLRSTRIRTVAKTLVTIPNKEIVDSTIDNLSKRPMRRCAITIGVTYDATAEKMQQLVSSLRRMLEEDDMAEHNGANVHFSTFGDSSLNVEMLFFIRTTEYSKFLQSRQDLNLKIMRIVEELGLDFAFPSTTVYLEK
ncbi:MAG: mechanosensitive ion channel family protein [Candidatus Sabulitectum sp.]|nr:mechanosensitive ion channel family protein [Candidatus Sabulitectum sp.]